MEAPLGFNENYNINPMYRLKKTNGLSQSFRAWFGRFTKTMVEMKYRQSQGNYTLLKHSTSSKVTILIVCVDGIIITGDDLQEIK